jgi:hypothetical protein
MMIPTTSVGVGGERDIERIRKGGPDHYHSRVPHPTSHNSTSPAASQQNHRRGWRASMETRQRRWCSVHDNEMEMRRRPPLGLIKKMKDNIYYFAHFSESGLWEGFGGSLVSHELSI